MPGGTVKFQPLGPTKVKPVVLLIPGRRTMSILTADGRRDVRGARDCRTTFSKLAKCCIYVPNALQALRYVTSPPEWEASTWRDRTTAMIHGPSGAKVTSLRGALDDAGSPEAQWDALCAVLRWLGGYGVPPGSLSAMSHNLWRASLARPVSIGAEPQLGAASFYGGRQECRRHTDARGQLVPYQRMVHVDIQAAYPHAMADHSYALSLRSVPATTSLDGTVAGLAHARVDVPPDLPFGPLPVRLGKAAISFQTGPIRGTWPWCELAAAQALGCRVDVIESWAPRTTGDLFATWWPMIESGRSLSGAAGHLAKAIGNCLWGQFAMDGCDRGIRRWTDEKGDESIAVTESDRAMPHRWTRHIAAETAARVRSRMLTEGIYGGPHQPVHVDTDGIIVRASASMPAPNGSDPGDWRVKATMPRVEIRAPQVFRWTCGQGCGVTHPKWHYQASGVSKELAPHLFDRTGHLVLAYAVATASDVCLPSTHSTDSTLIAANMAEAKALGVLL